jgi:hypothetical protein
MKRMGGGASLKLANALHFAALPEPSFAACPNLFRTTKKDTPCLDKAYPGAIMKIQKGAVALTVSPIERKTEC